MKSLIIGLGLLMVAVPSVAGPPADAVPMPYQDQVLCTPTLTSMIQALTDDYAVHISMTFMENPESGIMVVENPETGTAAILQTRQGSTCLIFSGRDLKKFVRPDNMAPPKVDIDAFEQQQQKKPTVGA